MRMSRMTRLNSKTGLPSAQGLYDPAHEHDACGIGFVANVRGHKSHDIILKGIEVLINLTHWGACGVGMPFLPVEKHQRLQCEGILERIVREEGLAVLGWRDTPVNASAIGRAARASQP